jgi:hypothetical protein
MSFSRFPPRVILAAAISALLLGLFVLPAYWD